MNAGNNPDIDPALNGTLLGSISFAMRKALQNIDNMLPARVIKYDRDTNRVQVELLIAMITTGGAQVSRPQIASIPVLVLGGGGFMLSFPLNTGDLGWVVANDRDISLFLQSYSESRPNTGRIKNFSDGMFIPDAMHDYTINGDDTNSVTLQTTDGLTRVSVSATGVTVTANSVSIDVTPTGVVIDAPTVTFTGEIIANGGITSTGGVPFTITGDIDLTGEFTQTGNMLVNGNIGATGTITPGV